MKKKLILLPGAGCSKEFYANVIPVLSKSFNVEIIEYSGKTFDENVKDLLGKLSSVKEKFLIVAHCFSGLLMVKALAKKRLNNLEGLVLCNSVADFTQLSPEFLGQDNGEHNSDYKDYDVVLEAKQHMLPQDIINNQLEIALATNVTDYLKYISVPTLVLGSDKDGYFPVNLYKNTYKFIPNAELEIVQGARHLGLLTHVHDYEECIMNWMGKIA